MREYDYEKAKEIIERQKNEGNLLEAVFGMHEDWFWTAESIWENGKYKFNLEDKPDIAGIKGSSWATPVLKLKYKSGKEKFVSCYKGEKSGEKPATLELGCLSEPVQENIPKYEGG